MRLKTREGTSVELQCRFANQGNEEQAWTVIEVCAAQARSSVNACGRGRNRYTNGYLLIGKEKRSV